MKFDSGETSISVFTAAFPLFIHTTPDRQILRSWKNITGNSCGRVHERALLSSTNFTIYHAPFHNISFPYIFLTIHLCHFVKVFPETAVEEESFFYREPGKKILPSRLGPYVHLQRQSSRALLSRSKSDQPALPDRRKQFV